MILRLWSFVLLGSLASVCSGQPQQFTTYFAGPSTSTFTLNRLPDGKLFTSVEVQGRSLSLFVDTGAATLLDCAVVKAMGRPLTETDDVATGLTGVAGKRRITTVDLTLGELKVTGQPVSCLDLSQLRALHARMGWPPLDGLIGVDLLTVLRARVDLEKGTLTIRRPSARSSASGSQLRKP